MVFIYLLIYKWYKSIAHILKYLYWYAVKLDFSMNCGWHILQYNTLHKQDCWAVYQNYLSFSFLFFIIHFNLNNMGLCVLILFHYLVGWLCDRLFHFHQAKAVEYPTLLYLLVVSSLMFSFLYTMYLLHCWASYVRFLFPVLISLSDLLPCAPQIS